MRVDLNTVEVGQELAIDQAHSYVSYKFCKVNRVTKAQIEVATEDRTYKFSKATGHILGGNSWDDKKYLVTKEVADAAIERERLYKETRREQHDIKKGLVDIANGYWDEAKIVELEALVQRMRTFITA